MSREKVIGSYLVRFVEKNRQPQFNLHNLKTGERLEFESWVAVWFFLDQLLQVAPTSDSKANATATALQRPRKKIATKGGEK